MLSQVYRSGTIGPANDAYGGGLLEGKAYQHGTRKGDKNSDLSPGPNNQGFGIGNKGPEISHGAQPQENDARDELPFKAVLIKQL